ncbi:unnamed protein product [Linum trigynum]|uniref:Uncharacterized protein n=1 Tax=Linum trigynum TaxID=586398 RepID=A0AAV2FAE4_9ROSI
MGKQEAGIIKQAGGCHYYTSRRRDGEQLKAACSREPGGGGLQAKAAPWKKAINSLLISRLEKPDMAE